MNLKRIIPILLLKDEELYKTVRFGQAKYVGDPINAVKIFNEKEVDCYFCFCLIFELTHVELIRSGQRR